MRNEGKNKDETKAKERKGGLIRKSVSEKRGARIRQLCVTVHGRWRVMRHKIDKCLLNVLCAATLPWLLGVRRGWL